MIDVYPILAQIKTCKDDAKLLDLISAASMSLIQNNYPYIPRIIQQVKKINESMSGNGVVHLELKMYNGDITEGVFHEVTKIRF